MKMYAKIPFNNFLVLILILAKRFVKAIEYPVTFGSCPADYQRINNGCYQFHNDSYVTWKDANDACRLMHNVSSAVTHLIAFESQAETISLSFWFKGNKYTASFWTDAIVDSNKRVWSWTKHDYVTFGYFKENFTTTKNPNIYLRNNNTVSHEYELMENSGLTKMGYICEAQLMCNETEADKCQHNGTCYINSGRVLCTCKEGYQGAYCEIMVDNCESVPCLHGAACTNQVNNYTCECTPYYNGRNCEIEIPNALEEGRKTALAISVSIVGLILLILCLMDLPWHAIRKALCPSDDEKIKKQKKNEVKVEKKRVEKQVEKKPTKEQLIATEEEMLKKFKLIMAQNNARKSAAITPGMRK